MITSETEVSSLSSTFSSDKYTNVILGDYKLTFQLSGSSSNVYPSHSLIIYVITNSAPIFPHVLYPLKAFKIILII